MRFYSIGDFGGYDSVHSLLSKHFGYEAVQNPEKADIVVWNGGADIGTSIYGEEPIDRWIPREQSIRDHREIDMFESFHASGKLLLGVCRGAQLLNCLSGGKLYQDVNHHTRDHDMVVLETGETIRITSTHHQQMRAGPDAEIICVANESTKKAWDGGMLVIEPATRVVDYQDLEVVWYPKTRALCVQGHPEYVPETRFARYVGELIAKYAKVTECVD